MRQQRPIVIEGRGSIVQNCWIEDDTVMLEGLLRRFTSRKIRSIARSQYRLWESLYVLPTVAANPSVGYSYHKQYSTWYAHKILKSKDTAD